MGSALIENECKELQPETMFLSAASFPSEPTVERLRPSFGTVIETLRREIGAIAERMISAQSNEEFQEIKKREFPAYAKLSFAIGNVVSSVLDQKDYARLVQKALQIAEDKFCVQAVEYLGEDQRQEVIFAFNALKRTYQLIPHLLSLSDKLSDEDKEQDKKLFISFASNVLASQLHLTCLEEAISGRRTVNPDVLEEIIGGIRSSVMAYACVRQALDLRGFSRHRYADVPQDVIWNDEDAHWADFSK